MTNAWQRAVRRFEEGYGDPLDLTDPVDQHAFSQILVDEIRDEVEREMGDAVEMIEAKTARLRGML